MNARGFGKGGPLTAIVGPDDTIRAEFAAVAHTVADDARRCAADAFAAGRTEAGAAILQFAERLTLLAGGRP